MKNIFKWVFFILCISCSQENNNLFDDFTLNGGFIEFEGKTPNTSFSFLEIPEEFINDEILDPNNNAISYALTLIHGEVEIEEFITINSFPNTLTITKQAVLEALGITENDLSPDTEFQFVANVTTPLGTFSGLNSDFNTETNTQEGGSIGSNSLQTTDNSAMNFDVSFFLPTPKKLRGTSFEEPYASDDPGADYTRPESQEDSDGELLNNLEERHVMHTALGTGEDDEIGFRSFFFSTGKGGFTNEEIGVTKKTEEVGSYIDGIQGFELEDIDGLHRLLFDTVEVNPATNPQTGVRIQVFFSSTDWEEDDTIHIYVEVEKEGNMETMDLLNINGGQIEELKDAWYIVDSGFLNDITSYQLIIDSETDSGNEEIYFDEMLIYTAEDN